MARKNVDSSMKKTAVKEATAATAEKDIQVPVKAASAEKAAPVEKKTEPTVEKKAAVAEEKAVSVEEKKAE